MASLGLESGTARSARASTADRPAGRSRPASPVSVLTALLTLVTEADETRRALRRRRYAALLGGRLSL